jgi:hypothetical protein
VPQREENALAPPAHYHILGLKDCLSAVMGGRFRFEFRQVMLGGGVAEDRSRRDAGIMHGRRERLLAVVPDRQVPAARHYVT